MKIHPPSFWIASASLLLTATSGLSQGVQILKDINIAPLGTSALADEMAVVGNKLYISTDDDIVGSELWLLNVAGSFNSPKSVALDGSSNVYVADTSNHRIRLLKPSGSTPHLSCRFLHLFLSCLSQCFLFCVGLLSWSHVVFPL